MHTGPNIKRDGLVFGYDTGANPSSNFDHRVTSRRHFKGKPTVNFFPDGHFPDGNDMESEAGSNPQNDVVLLKNPGDSPYVLRQTMGSAYTEYQINLTTELQASTTYVLSGWYAESTDYDASNRMFHCRASSAGGNNVALGTGIYNVINTKIVNGITWRYCYATITTPSDYSNTFYWYVGYSNDSYSGARYYTNLKMEQGSYPTPYVAGTRSSTQSLIDLTKTTNIDVSNVSFDSTGQPTIDGTDDENNTGITTQLTDFSCVVVFKDEGSATWGRIVDKSYTTGFFISSCYNGSSTSVGAGIIEPNFPHGQYLTYDNTKYNYFVVTRSGTTHTIYLNGSTNSASKTGSGATLSSTEMAIGAWYGSTNSQRFTGEIPVVKLYNRALTPKEIQQDFRAYKNRFNI